MAWLSLKGSAQLLGWVTAVVGLIFIVIWGLKIRNIQRLKMDVVQLERQLGSGQELWKNYPPLAPQERRDLQEAQEHLFRMLPRDMDIPPVLQEVSRLAREHNLTHVSFHAGEGAAAPGEAQPTSPAGAQPQVVPQPTPAAPQKVAESSGPIDYFPLKVTFAGDYREIAYFLEAMEKIPRVITIQSLQLQRGVPLVVAEVMVRAYYYKEGPSVKTK
jgi:Tfp pilus assembly protein PilO